MFHKEAIDTNILELLIELQSLDILKDFYLAGGTSLAMQIGHRKSLDLDLSGKLDGGEIEINESLQHFKNVHLLKKVKTKIMQEVKNYVNEAF
ncbi:MAG TPA: nucleotidyl transferase AbiEii/AbiGii toxin family protein [Bacteroidales bacterium]|nr:nucleotidyl transferase AbiEii/AbiGii toxin family protein [Bacteroidales bacterium]